MQALKSECGAAFSRVARRNGSISVAGVLAVFGSLMLLAMAIGGVFAVMGAWLILPFAGIEIGVLALALWWILRHAHDYEEIRLNRGMLEVEVADGASLLRRQFNPLWARVVLEARGADARVTLRSHGREFEIGRYLSAEDKRGLANSLGALGMRLG